MPKMFDVFDYLDSRFPFCTQLGFDNAGFLVGDRGEELKKGVVALDITDAAIDFAKEAGANLIVSHHPVIFEPLRSVTENDIVYKLIKNGISAICAHTNLDMCDGGVNDCLCRAIGLENTVGALPEGDVDSARLGELTAPLSANDFAEMLKSKLHCAVKYTDSKKTIKKVGVCSGSGGSMLFDIAKLSADAFVTADVKHNIFLDAKHLGISIFDCGHFETENVVVAPLCEQLNDNFDNVFIPFLKSEIKHI